MTLIDYLDYKLEDPEFRKCWMELHPDCKLNDISIGDESILEAVRRVFESTPDEILKNRGIDTGISIPMNVVFYEMGGKCPVADFLEDIPNKKLQSRTLDSIAQLAALGSTAREPLSKYVGDGMYELRTKFASDITRIFYFFIEGNSVVLTNGYIKKSAKMDTREFDRAKRYRDTYICSKRGSQNA